ncbi:hypothetical protein C8D70_104185 [Chryseobacterium sp. CBTAP 102]|uniref:DUF6602 domain-containing protein n=1 Tax=Chryseobacterium sp. CBTAP 102 TaxID=2135644 RepID=UPI000D769970|nr:DUF6602 domain-containing protein [Chryseobacterium sp. CBTAP 102]PXW16247.1 hypothetical protein C8D70_104185 [Chryseobacterium sp. CBTAP 102]
MPPQNIRRFQESITQELNVINNRVRDLIGDANWAEEGRYKEAVLIKVISQFLPSNLRIGTGFIVSNNDHLNGTEGTISKQLDIIVYEEKTPVVFREGDFVILTENSVRAVIEVKSEIENYSSTKDNALNKIIEKLNLLRNFESFSNQNNRRKFIGIFSFNYNGNFLHHRINEALTVSNGLVNHISLGTENFIRYWEHTEGLMPPLNRNGRCYIRYNLINLSFSYFISNLLHIISDHDPIERYWFSFPIVGTKEVHRENEHIIYLE